ncbi:Deoxyribose-phosphate aldolase [Folsomia candida]|uniref:Deoxyribose-phosphate aldolase n=1 Tax=Folsomia candida TaxID=158441 RepID=A0A226D4A0_FOLCA|nr:Deoxyribose-phosphate aldolase [Folsomia candida]
MSCKLILVFTIVFAPFNTLARSTPAEDVSRLPTEFYTRFILASTLKLGQSCSWKRIHSKDSGFDNILGYPLGGEPLRLGGRGDLRALLRGQRSPGVWLWVGWVVSGTWKNYWKLGNCWVTSSTDCLTPGKQNYKY